VSYHLTAAADETYLRLKDNIFFALGQGLPWVETYICTSMKAVTYITYPGNRDHTFFILTKIIYELEPFPAPAYWASQLNTDAYITNILHMENRDFTLHVDQVWFVVYPSARRSLIV